jgi:hypothetical protein
MKTAWISQLLRQNHPTADKDTEKHDLFGITVLIINGKVAPLDHKTLLIHSSCVFRVVNVWCAFGEKMEMNSDHIVTNRTAGFIFRKAGTSSPLLFHLFY